MVDVCELTCMQPCQSRVGDIETNDVSAAITALLTCRQVQGQPLMVQVSGGQLITSSGQPIMVQAMSGAQGQTIMQVPVSGAQGLQQVKAAGRASV